MKVSSNEIYVDGTYLNNNPGWGEQDSVWKAQIIYDVLNKNNIAPKEITEVGCGAGGILQELSRSFGHATFQGYDISPHAIEIAKRKENTRIKFHNEDVSQLEYLHTDVLLMIDVLEHVDDYYGMLRSLKSKSNHFVFHIPLDLSCRTVLKPHVLLQQRTSVGHIHYFTKEIVMWMLKDTGYEMVDWVYTKPVTDVQPADTFKRRTKKLLRNFSFSLNQNLSAKLWGNYSMMILAK